MERAAWTDERLDDLSRRMDAGFGRVDEDIRDLRRELRGGFTQVAGSFHDSDRRIDGLGSELRTEIEALRLTLLRVGGGIMVGLVGVIAAVLARGA